MNRIAVWKKVVPSSFLLWKTVSQWLSNHQKAITLVSAFTVLTTFIVKEVLDEFEKDLLSSIGKLQSDGNHASEEIGMFNWLTSIGEDVRLIREKTVEGKPVAEVDRQLSRLRADQLKRNTQIGESIAVLDFMTEVLSAGFREREKEFVDEYTTLQRDSTSTWKAAATDQASMQALTKSAQEWTVLSDRAPKILGEGTRGLTSLREDAEQRHRVYQGIVYFSFGLGWVVGLAASLVGAKAPPGES